MTSLASDNCSTMCPTAANNIPVLSAMPVPASCRCRCASSDLFARVDSQGCAKCKENRPNQQDRIDGSGCLRQDQFLCHDEAKAKAVDTWPNQLRVVKLVFPYSPEHAMAARAGVG